MEKRKEALSIIRNVGREEKIREEKKKGRRGHCRSCQND